MAQLTKIKLKKILTEKLALKDPRYLLETTGGRIVGDIISSSFKGKPDHERLDMIWDALEESLGKEATALVGMLLIYTPEEWNLGAEDKPKTTKRRKVG
jgi:acid stress-induced BolA-like protein IbaG/YrbA